MQLINKYETESEIDTIVEDTVRESKTIAYNILLSMTLVFTFILAIVFLFVIIYSITVR